MDDPVKSKVKAIEKFLMDVEFDGRLTTWSEVISVLNSFAMSGGAEDFSLSPDGEALSFVISSGDRSQQVHIFHMRPPDGEPEWLQCESACGPLEAKAVMTAVTALSRQDLPGANKLGATAYPASDGTLFLALRWVTPIAGPTVRQLLGGLDNLAGVADMFERGILDGADYF